MKERPILMTADSVRAILAGRKSQTRRVVKPQPERAEHDRHGGHYTWTTRTRGIWYAWQRGEMGYQFDPSIANCCPYGAPGDRLWVREAWGEFARRPGVPVYRADDPLALNRWRSPIHMPRWAARLWLEIVAVRVERVQDISEADAEAEGAELLPCTYGGDCHKNSCPRHGRLDRYRLAYAALWDSINGKTHPWASNSWVWVLEFRRVEP